jgi:hypothetical protein
MIPLMLHYLPLAGPQVIVIGLAMFVFFTTVVTLAARDRGRDHIAWMIFAIFLTPVIAGLCLILFPINQHAVDRRRSLEEGRRLQQIADRQELTYARTRAR